MSIFEYHFWGKIALGLCMHGYDWYAWFWYVTEKTGHGVRDNIWGGCEY